MTTLLSSKIVTARKPHRCCNCEVVCIQPGQQYRRAASVFDGRAYTWVSCADCDAIFDVVWEWAGEPWGDGIGPDSYAEWAHEMRDQDERAAAYLARRAECRDGADEGGQG